MLLLHAVERGRKRPERGWRVEHPKRVTGGGGVDDDDVVGAAGCEPGDFEEGGELVDAWQRKLEKTRDVLLVQPRAAERDALQRGAPVCQPSPQGGGCVDFDRVQRAATGWNPSWRGPERAHECIAEGRSGIGRNHERAGSARGGVQGDSGGARGLANAALAADEQVVGPRCLPDQARSSC